MTELLFSYGTLRQPEVQRATFGREIEGRPDAIIGYDLDYVTITDPNVIATSGSDRHPILESFNVFYRFDIDERERPARMAEFRKMMQKEVLRRLG